MRTFVCDVCHTIVPSIHLEELEKKYQTKDIKDACHKCTDELDKKLVEIRLLHSVLIETEVKNYIKELAKNGQNRNS